MYLSESFRLSSTLSSDPSKDLSSISMHVYPSNPMSVNADTPYKMRRIIINSDVITVQNLKNFSPDHRCCHQVLSTRPLISVKKHRTVFNRNAHFLFFCITCRTRAGLPTFSASPGLLPDALQKSSFQAASSPNCLPLSVKQF